MKVPLILDAVLLLAFAILLPLLVGTAARIFFLRPDDDDSGLLKRAGVDDYLPSPEPDPRYQDPWPDFPRDPPRKE